MLNSKISRFKSYNCTSETVNILFYNEICLNKGEIDYKSAGAELKSVKILDEKNIFSADAYFHSLHLSSSYWVALLLIKAQFTCQA